ncbi:Crp/Fnr family transcriptional regulator [Niabella yanshanensis]|uniref:Crp/Fnr family transcriptional regulator n=1 Tax=Niabella yanshanensis TaxID=577386 RepID=A0ABZ0WBY1_9BACT|nr:Crp/Fnr family transcriptional regulator [Niabella yanshanensis]WQD40234.1 Crp/Fnr family transcriptional regulator [Niabella yanshanensis]
MHIDYDILITYGGVARKFEKGSYLFHEDAMPYYFYQVVSGSIKLFSTNSEGKDLTQGIFTDGHSFGEPPLLLGKAYPSTAQACTDSVVIKLRKEHFLSILHDYPDLNQKLIYTFAGRIYKKATAVQTWVQQTPEEKISHFLKTNKCVDAYGTMQQVPYTRQQIADFTGLRVETVIRTLMKMKTKRMVKIVDHKLYY